MVAIHQLSGPAAGIAGEKGSAATTALRTPRVNPETTAASQTARAGTPGPGRWASRRCATRKNHAKTPTNTPTPSTKPTTPLAAAGVTRGPVNAYPTGPPRHHCAAGPTAAITVTTNMIAAAIEVGAGEGVPGPSATPAPAGDRAPALNAIAGAAATSGPISRNFIAANPLVARANRAAEPAARCSPISGTTAVRPVAAVARAAAPTTATQATTKTHMAVIAGRPIRAVRYTGIAVPTSRIGRPTTSGAQR